MRSPRALLLIALRKQGLSRLGLEGGGGEENLENLHLSVLGESEMSGLRRPETSSL
jgi:hypothetical protein